MLYWSLQITIVSIILIFLVHHLINFFKSTLTVPKIRDLVNAPTQKYENMYNIISHSKNENEKKDDLNEKKDYTDIDLLPKPNVDNMKNELKSFLKEQLKNANTNKNTNDLNNYFPSKQQFSTYLESTYSEY